MCTCLLDASSRAQTTIHTDTGPLLHSYSQRTSSANPVPSSFAPAQTFPVCKSPPPLVPSSWAHVTRAAFYSLGDNRWLQDEVVNCYIGLLAGENRQCSSDCHFFNASFYRKLAEYRHRDGSVGYSYDRVARWTKKVNLFSKRLVIIPVHRPRRKHWILVAILMQGEQILSRSNNSH